MFDKYEKLMRKYPPPRWEYRYIKGKRIRIRAKPTNEYDGAVTTSANEESGQNPNDLFEEEGEAQASEYSADEEASSNNEEDSAKPNQVKVEAEIT